MGASFLVIAMQSNGEIQTNGDCSTHLSEADNFVPVRKPSKFIGKGYFDDVVHLYSECGHLIWMDPKGCIRVLFTYGDTGCDFT
ncbi:hypothetical protein Ciccas_007757 [Cichlidogyrus casuarinus]|uniref:Uncharacterized protein n=1 Tax=Cichlidogyrus casuarinus TaxID=1844966 RepID=A0ABD2Q2C2_9PLAT